MPNHVTNRIRLSGERSEINRLMEAVKADNIGLGSIDFNKVIPQPESLDIESGGWTNRALNAYEDLVNIVKQLGKDTVTEQAEQAFLNLRTDISAELLSLGKQAYENTQKYGFPTWYEWSVAKWGTKWNSYGYDGFDLSENSDTIYFMTAWSAPHPVMEKLSEMFPAVKISHEWADEDIGYNCGRREYYGGERTGEYYPETKKDRLEFAADVMDVQLQEDYALYLNASETGYIEIEGDDKYEKIELFGKPALFTNDRITDADIPKGMYSYHIRHGDDGVMCAIEKRVAVNHAGSVITKEPLDLGKEGYISLNADNEPDFIGETMSLYEFLESGEAENEDMGMEMNT